jgi:hypothetical protein
MASSTLRKRSPLWKYFNVKEDNSEIAICLICAKEIPRKDSNTKGMPDHLKTEHADEWKDFEGLDEEVKNKLAEAEENKKSMAILNQKSAQTAITAFFDGNKSQKYEATNVRQQLFIVKVAKFIVGDLQAYSVVDGEYFLEMIGFADQKFTLPSSKHFRTVVIPKLYDYIATKIQIILNDSVDFCCVDIDIWTSACQNSYLSLSVHYVDKNTFVRKHCILGLQHLPQSHTADYIGQNLEDLLQKWNLSSKVHLFFRDNALNMVKLFDDRGWPHAGDHAHKLHLAAQHACESQQSVLNMFSRSQSIVAHFRRSPMHMNSLSDLQKQLNLPVSKLVIAGDTRWNSRCEQSERLLEQKEAIVILQNRLKLTQKLTEDDWKIMESACQLMQPFRKISLRAQKRDCCISECIPLTRYSFL